MKLQKLKTEEREAYTTFRHGRQLGTEAHADAYTNLGRIYQETGHYMKLKIIFETQEAAK